MLLMVALSAGAQADGPVKVEGSVVDFTGPVPYVTVAVEALHSSQSPVGTVTGEDGGFQLYLEAGVYRLTFSAVGYRLVSREMTVEASALSLPPIELRESSVDLETLVVSGTMRETSLAESPVKVEVISGKLLRDRGGINLVDVAQNVNGVEEVVGCGVCFTNSLSVNGLPGTYTAILIDGAPIMGNLASVYGLNGLPAGLVERVEILRGPHSTLYGSEALAGVINVITRSPSSSPRLNLVSVGDSHGETALDLSTRWRAGRTTASLGGQYTTVLGGLADQNQDGFVDHIRADRVSLYSRFQLKGKEEKANPGALDMQLRMYGENRRNGVLDYMREPGAWRSLRGNDSIYGESILTRRAELFGNWKLPLSENLRLSFSGSHHFQDSYYGADSYLATQQIYWFDFSWNREFLGSSGSHFLTAGSSFRETHYDDNTVATEGDGVNLPERQRIPGLYLQHEWEYFPGLTAVSGMRLDHYGDHGMIPAPRLSLKYAPNPDLALRINTGTGFRIVSLFTEDHAFVTGQRDVVIEGRLNPERSWNLTLDASRSYRGKTGQGRLEVYGYYTRFSNKIIPDYEEPGKIIYANSEGLAHSAGGGAEINHDLSVPLSLRLAVQVQRVREQEGPEVRAIEFAPDWSGLASLRWRWEKPGVNFTWLSRVTGPMQLPEVYDVDAQTGLPLADPRPLRSRPFLITDFQLSHLIPSIDLTLRGGVRNILNNIQDLPPVAGHNDPNSLPGFSEYFDTAYAYRAIEGRAFWIGIEWNLN